MGKKLENTVEKNWKKEQCLHIVATPLHNVFSNRTLNYGTKSKDLARKREIQHRLDFLRKEDELAKWKLEHKTKHRVYLMPPPQVVVNPPPQFNPEAQKEYIELRKELEAIDDSRPFGGLGENDPVFLVSAHVETSESSGIGGFFNHISANFGKVADYHSGKEKGSQLLLRNAPEEFRRVENKNRENLDISVFDIDITNPINLFRAIFHVIREDINSADSTKPVFPESKQYKLLRVSEKIQKNGWLYLLLILCGLLLLIIFPVVAFAMGFLGLDYVISARSLLAGMDQASKSQQVVLLNISLEMLWAILYWFFVVLSVLFSSLLVYSGLKKLPNYEKDGLLGVLSGLAILPLGFIVLPTSLSLEFRAWFFVALGSFIFLNYVFLAGFSFPSFRFVTVSVFVLVLGEIFIPVFVAGGIVRLLSLVAFALVFLILISVSFNFMKSVELIHELEHSFALFVGYSGEQRQALKQEFQRFMGISEKQSAFQRFTEVIRVYLGFRPQGDIEFHIPLEKTNDKVAPETGFPVYPVKNLYFDGNLLQFSIEKSTGITADLVFSGFRPQ